MAQNLKLNDKVRVISGDHKGKEAKIVKMDRKNHKACLEGIGIKERHIKKSYLNPTGGKKTIHVGIDLSKLKLIEAAKVEKKATKATKTTKATSKTTKTKKGAK